MYTSTICTCVRITEFSGFIIVRSENHHFAMGSKILNSEIYADFRGFEALEVIIFTLLYVLQAKILDISY